MEAAGWRVLMPAGHACCGRPLYDYGFLGLAERYLRRVLAAVRPALAEGLPVVGVEPSCVATFRHELEAAWRPATAARGVRWPLALRVGRV